MNQDNIGKFIRDLRISNHLTQASLANKLNVTYQAVSKWENGRGIPDIETLKLISKEFNVSIDNLIDGKKSIKKHNKLLIPIIIVSVLIIIMLIFLITHNDFKTLDIESADSTFVIKGVAAYSMDKNAIYITSIQYLKDDTNLYVLKECNLYESNNDTDKTISKCSGGYDSYNKESANTLNDILSNINFKVDNYTTSCSNLTKANLFLAINVIDSNNNVIVYNIPLKLDNDCN